VLDGKDCTLFQSISFSLRSTDIKVQSSKNHCPLLRLGFDSMYFEIWQPVFQRNSLPPLKGISNDCKLKRTIAASPEKLLTTNKLPKPK